MVGWLNARCSFRGAVPCSSPSVFCRVFSPSYARAASNSFLARSCPRYVGEVHILDTPSLASTFLPDTVTGFVSSSAHAFCRAFRAASADVVLPFLFPDSTSFSHLVGWGSGTVVVDTVGSMTGNAKEMLSVKRTATHFVLRM